MSDRNSVKPFHLVSRRKGLAQTVSATDVGQFEETILNYLRDDEKNHPFLAPNVKWSAKKTADRGFKGDDAAIKAAIVDNILFTIATYAPLPVYKEITDQCTSLMECWKVIREWAGIQASCMMHLNYSKIKNSFDTNGDTTMQEFFYKLRDAKEACLLKPSSGVSFLGKAFQKDEEMTPSVESGVVMDWLEVIGGQALVEHVCRVFAKDLEKVTLADLQIKISNAIDTLIAEKDTREEMEINEPTSETNEEGEKTFQKEYSTTADVCPEEAATQGRQRLASFFSKYCEEHDFSQHKKRN